MEKHISKHSKADKSALSAFIIRTARKVLKILKKKKKGHFYHDHTTSLSLRNGEMRDVRRSSRGCRGTFLCGLGIKSKRKGT